MALRDLLGNIEKEVDCGGIKFLVRPISMDGISKLFDSFSDIFSALMEGRLKVTELFKTAPEFGVEFIRLGLIEELTSAEIKKLPVGVQLKTLDEIWTISQLDIVYLEKLIRRFTEGMKGSAIEIPKKAVLSNFKKVSAK